LFLASPFVLREAWLTKNFQKTRLRRSGGALPAGADFAITIFGDVRLTAFSQL
jgi:hypothetical protein